jgi:hypothetical protein
MFMTFATDRCGIWKVHLSRNMVFLKLRSILCNFGNFADYATIAVDTLLRIFEQLGKIKAIRFA